MLPVMSRKEGSGSFPLANKTVIPSTSDGYASPPTQIVNQTPHIPGSYVAAALPIYNQVDDTTTNGFHSVLPTSNPSITYICRLGTGCPFPLNGTTTSIYLHLRDHGPIHKHRDRAPCPWLGCSKAMRWGNVARHIIERHLDVKQECVYCGKKYKRSGDRNAHLMVCIEVGSLTYPTG